MKRTNFVADDFVFDLLSRVIIFIAMAVILYPMVFVVSMSISSQEAVLRNSVWLLPKGFSLKTYELLLSSPNIYSGYLNSAYYAITSGILGGFVTMAGAYAISQNEFFGRKLFMKMIVFTMLFQPGLIPSYLLVRNLGLYNTRWAIILPPLIGTFNFIVARSYLERTPDSIIESAKIDGHNDISIFFRLIIPISKPIIAVLFLFYAVDRWNSYFSALLYLRSNSLKPLQIFLMDVFYFETSDVMFNSSTVETDLVERFVLSRQMQYSLIIVATLPILATYPMLQKYFVQGMMVGSLKE